MHVPSLPRKTRVRVERCSYSICLPLNEKEILGREFVSIASSSGTGRFVRRGTRRHILTFVACTQGRNPSGTLIFVYLQTKQNQFPNSFTLFALTLLILRKSKGTLSLFPVVTFLIVSHNSRWPNNK